MVTPAPELPEPTPAQRWSPTRLDGPVVTVRRGAKALLTTGDQVLLIAERRADGSTFWTLPGGGLRPGETPAAGLRRELAEELQCDVVVQDAVAGSIYRHKTRPDTVTVYTVFAGSLVGEPVPNGREGVVACRWTATDDIPPATLGPFRQLIDAFREAPEALALEIEPSPDR